LLRYLKEEFRPKRVMAKNKFTLFGVDFYVLKKDYRGKPTKIFICYRMSDWVVVTVGDSHEKIKQIVKDRYERKFTT